ncbi:MAG: PilN domain-containing protein [Deltaproteobacteria bacterium]|nr:PilN domain-containing protein [Deltaproteobacteria bacterium]
MMVEINLLPHREARRAADIRETIALLVLGLIVLGGGMYFLASNAKSDLEQARITVAQLEADIERYKPQQALIGKFKQRKQNLQDKLDVIASLERARNGPVRVLDEISTRVPDRLWLTQISTKGNEIRLKGKSLDTGVVADFLRALNGSAYFKNVDLEKTAGGELVKGVRLVNFELRADMTAPAAPAKKAKEDAKAPKTAETDARTLSAAKPS